MKKVIFSLLRVFISILLIVILLYIMRDKYADIAARLKGTNMALFSLAFLAFAGATLIASLRLKMIGAAQELSMTFGEAASLTFIGYFFNNFLPTTIGGDVVKAYYLAKNTDDKMASFTSVFIDRMLGLFTMIFMAFIGLFFVKGGAIDRNISNAIYIITIASAAAVLFMTNRAFARLFLVFLKAFRPIEERLKRAYNAVYSYKHHKVLIAQSLVISVVSQIVFFISIGILVYAIGGKINMMDILLRMPIISTLSLLPSLNGLGVREGSTVLLFSPLIGREGAFAISVLWLLVLLITSIIGGAIYGLSPQFKIKLEEVG